MWAVDPRSDRANFTLTETNHSSLASSSTLALDNESNLFGDYNNEMEYQGDIATGKHTTSELHSVLTGSFGSDGTS